MKEMRQFVLGQTHKNSILGHMTKFLESRQVFTIPQYCEMFLNFNKVYCFKCRLEIKLGDHCTSIGKGGGRLTHKYYHTECHDKMYY